MALQHRLAKENRQALAAAGIAFDERLVRNGDWLPLTGYHYAFDLLALEDPPTAIFCGNDLMAIGVMEAVSELGLKVPEQLSVMGYDDQELARYTHPPLSTLVLPNYEMGQKAAETLIDMVIHQKAFRPMTIKIDGPLVPDAAGRFRSGAVLAIMRSITGGVHGPREEERMEKRYEFEGAEVIEADLTRDSALVERRLREDAWGQGYAREAATATLDFAFDRLDAERVVAVTYQQNEASWGLMLRLGMRRRDDLGYDDPRFPELNPTVVYEIQREEWRR